MIYREFIKYCEKQEEKPQYTTKFIKQYQQRNRSGNTYLYEAKMQGKEVCKEKGEPDQKWHLLSSWYKYKELEICDKEIDQWCNFRCPELLIWIAEVSGQEDKVKEVVEMMIDSDIYKANDGVARNKMVKLIKDEIEWIDILNYVEFNLKKE